MTRAIMNGCNGKMGQCITGICAQDEDIEIVAGIDTYDGIKNDYPVFASLKECTVDADVIIDFSNAKAVDALLAYGVEKQIPIVLCTTGLSEQQLADVEKAYEKVAILKSANMSLGINTLMELLKKAAGSNQKPPFLRYPQHRSLQHQSENFPVLRGRILYGD